MSETSDKMATATLQQPASIPGGGSGLSSDQFFREVLNNLPAAVYTTDAEGRITYFNEAAAAFWGHKPELGTDKWCGSWKLFWPDGTAMPHGDCPMAIAIKERRPIRGVEGIAERPDGTRVPFVPYPTPLLDASGELIGAVNMLVDVSDRHRAAEIHERLAAIVESSDDAIISKDLNGIISSWNRGAEQLFGYTADEMVGRSITTLIPLDRLDEEAIILSRIRRNERVEHYETVRRRKDGTSVELSISVSPIKDVRGRVIGASKIARDITERRRAQKQQDMLLGEMKHRTRNFVAVIDAIARQTRPQNAPEAEALLNLFVGRLRALLSTGEIVVESATRRAPLRQLFDTALQPFVNPGQPSQIALQGPLVEVSEQTAGGLALAMHELATNALKYGALKTPGGHVSLIWSVDDAGHVLVEWREYGAAPITAVPTRSGFGSRVIKSAVAGEMNGKTKLMFEPEGVRCQFEFELSDRRIVQP